MSKPNGLSLGWYLFATLIAAINLPLGVGLGQYIMKRSAQTSLVQSGHAIYVTDKKTGVATWQLLPPATQPRTAGDAEGGR